MQKAEAVKPASSTSILGVRKGKLVLAAPPDRPASGSLRYALGFPFQAGPHTMGLMVSRQIEQTPNYGFLDGSDIVLLNELKPPSPAQIFKATRNETEKGLAGEPPRLLLRSPLMGGFVPCGALRSDRTPHPHAGTGFGIAQAQRFAFRDGRFSWGDPGRQDLIEVYQLAYDGANFTTRKTRVWTQNASDPLKVGDGGWRVLVAGITNAIPDGDHFLLPMMAARTDGASVAVGIVRWARLSGTWQPTRFDPVAETRMTLPPGPNPIERCPWMEPSLALDGNGHLLFSVRFADSHAGDGGQGYRLGLWRSTKAGEWELRLDASQARLNSPVTVNAAADGSAYLISNPYDPAFIPETDATGRGRERLVLWPVDIERRRLESARPLRDCLAEFGEPPSAGRSEFWMADHPNGMTVRLQDGCWHHILAYRVCHCPRYRPSGAAPSLASGCYAEEIESRGPARPVWLFSDGCAPEGPLLAAARFSREYI